jgi:hypothetical protein
LLADVVKAINDRWGKLDAVVFPGGFLRLDRHFGPLSYGNRIEALNSAGLVAPFKEAVAALDRSPGVLIVFGVDGPSYPNGNGGDQLCIAAALSGIVGIGRKIFPVRNEAASLLCYDADFCEAQRIVELPSGRRAILSACYDMFGVAEFGDISGARAKKIQLIGRHEDQLNRSEYGFKNRLSENLRKFRTLLHGVTVGIAAIHGFDSPKTGFWQRHGLATCSAALDGGFAVAAAHFRKLPNQATSSTLAAARVPKQHLRDGHHRQAHGWVPNDDFTYRRGPWTSLIRLFC